jgi:hypothetical protein
MFEVSSRYYNLETVTLTVRDEDGQIRLIRYKRRRFIPSSAGSTTILEHRVADGDRLDNLAARYLGDPLQFWRLCDTNNAQNPQELTIEPGRVMLIALPKLGV